jgi:hypothetical protein
MLRVLCLQLFIRLPIIKCCGTLLQFMLNPCQKWPFRRPIAEWPKNFVVLCSAFSPADQKIVSDDTRKMTMCQHYIGFIHNLTVLVSTF